MTHWIICNSWNSWTFFILFYMLSFRHCYSTIWMTIKRISKKYASKNTRKDNHNTNTFSKHLLQSKYLLRWVCFFRYKMTYIYQRYSVNCIWKHIWITHFYINKPSARYLACHNMSFYIIHIIVAFITQSGNVMSKSKSRYVQTKTQSI